MSGAAPKRGRSMAGICSMKLLIHFLLHTVAKKTKHFHVSPKQAEVPLQQTLALSETDDFADKILCGTHIALLRVYLCIK